MSIQFIWSDEYSVSDEKNDSQPKKYITVHFTTEEQHMTAMSFPEMEKHRAMHEQLTTNLNTLSLWFKSVQLGELIDILHQWFINHLLKEYKKYLHFPNHMRR